MTTENTTKTPIELMADLLAVMTARAVEAERQRDEAQKSSDEWYGHWQTKDAQLKKTEAKLAEEIEKNKKYEETFKKYTEKQDAIIEAEENYKASEALNEEEQKGATEDGESD